MLSHLEFRGLAFALCFLLGRSFTQPPHARRSTTPTRAHEGSHCGRQEATRTRHDVLPRFKKFFPGDCHHFGFLLPPRRMRRENTQTHKQRETPPHAKLRGRNTTSTHAPRNSPPRHTKTHDVLPCATRRTPPQRRKKYRCSSSHQPNQPPHLHYRGLMRVCQACSRHSPGAPRRLPSTTMAWSKVPIAVMAVASTPWPRISSAPRPSTCALRR